MKKNYPNWGTGKQTTRNKLGQSRPAGSWAALQACTRGARLGAAPHAHQSWLGTNGLRCWLVENSPLQGVHMPFLPTLGQVPISALHRHGRGQGSSSQVINLGSCSTDSWMSGSQPHRHVIRDPWALLLSDWPRFMGPLGPNLYQLSHVRRCSVSEETGCGQFDS